jgi:hypothetical protein
MNEAAGRASYAYAVARSFDPARLAGVRGVDGAEVRLVEFRDLVAVVSPVPLAEFDEAALRTKLEWLPWLEATARAHHAVVDAVAASSVTLPLRLATVYRGDERVTEVLRQGHRRFRAALDRLAGRVELGVKVSTDPPGDGGGGRTIGLQPRQGLPQAAPGAPPRATTPGGGRPQPPSGWTRPWRGSPSTAASARRSVHSSPGHVARTSSTPPTWSTRHASRCSPPWPGASMRKRQAPASSSPVQGALLLRPGRRRGAHVNGDREVALVDLLDRLVAGGVVLTGDLTLTIADVDLVRISLRALIASIDAGLDR